MATVGGGVGVERGRRKERRRRVSNEEEGRKRERKERKKKKVSLFFSLLLTHGEAAVLDLLDLELLQGLGVVGQAQGVEGASRVKRVEPVKDRGIKLADARGVARGALSGSAEALDGGDQRHVDGGDGGQRQRVGDDPSGHGEVGQRAGVGELERRVEPGRAAQVGAVGLEALRDDGPGGAEHGPAGVEKLVGAVLLDALGVLAEAQGVVAVAVVGCF